MAVVLRAASLLLAYEGEFNTSSNPVPRLVEFQSLSKLTAALSTRKWKLTKGTSAATAAGHDLAVALGHYGKAEPYASLLAALHTARATAYQALLEDPPIGGVIPSLSIISL